MTDAATPPPVTTAPTNKETFIELRSQLSVLLPGLTDDELDELTQDSFSEWIDRVGEQLHATLSPSQRTEYDALDSDPVGDVGAWLTAAIPNHTAIALQSRAVLVAEVFASVSQRLPRALAGRRRFAELHSPSVDMIEGYCRRNDLMFEPTEKLVAIPNAADGDDCPRMTLFAELASSRALLTVTALSPDLTFTEDSLSVLHELARQWNAETWCPKAVVSVDEKRNTVHLKAEIAIPLPSAVCQNVVDPALKESTSLATVFFARSAEQTREHQASHG